MPDGTRTPDGADLGPHPGPMARIAAFAIDWLILSVYGMGLFGVVVLVVGIDGIEKGAEEHDPVRGLLIGFFTMTMPFALYFALSESSKRSATPGKRVLGLLTVDAGGNRLTFGRALARVAVKFLPWEIGHVFTHHIVAHGMRSPDLPEPAWLMVLLAISMGGAGVYGISLFVGDGRTPYDRLAGTRVIRAADSAPPNPIG